MPQAIAKASQQATGNVTEAAEQPGSTAALTTPLDDEDDEQETCGFCRFMKGGGCRKAFIEWSACVDQEKSKGEDFTEECKEKTWALRECMLQHKEYYAPLLDEEEEFAKEQEAVEAGEATAAATAAAADAAAVSKQ